MVKATATLLAVVCAAALAVGCFWRHYEGRMRTHVEVLVAVARKARDLVASGRFTAESLPELTYPLERATAFAAEARRRSPEPPASLQAFDALLGAYRAYVDVLDRVRRESPAAAIDALAAPLAAVERSADDVQDVLSREHP